MATGPIALPSVMMPRSIRQPSAPQVPVADSQGAQQIDQFFDLTKGLIQALAMQGQPAAPAESGGKGKGNARGPAGGGGLPPGQQRKLDSGKPLRGPWGQVAALQQQQQAQNAQVAQGANGLLDMFRMLTKEVAGVGGTPQPVQPGSAMSIQGASLPAASPQAARVNTLLPEIDRQIAAFNRLANPGGSLLA